MQQMKALRCHSRWGGYKTNETLPSRWLVCYTNKIFKTQSIEQYILNKSYVQIDMEMQKKNI